MPSNRALTRQPPMREKRNFRIGAIDVETRGLNGALLLAQTFHEDWPEARIYTTAEHMLEDILSLPRDQLKHTYWYAHNAEYDWRYMLAAFKNFGNLYDFIPLERAKGKFFQINVVSKTEKDKKDRPLLITSFRDSFSLYPMSLLEFTNSFAPQYKKQDIGLSFTEFDPTNPVHIDYAKNDVIGLVSALKGFDAELYKHFHVHIRGTIASTAFSAWLRFAPVGEYYDRPTPTTDAFFRECYKGGVVQMNNEHDGIVAGEDENVTFLDINSSYAYAMKLGVPKGKPVETTEYVADRPGFYYARVDVPLDAILPIIGTRTDNGLVWPVGKFWAYVSSTEIEHAQKLGVKFEIDYGYYFPAGISYCFTEFIDLCEKLRTLFKGTPTETVIKLIQNSVYGRFGMRPEGRECIITFSPVDMDEWNAIFDEDNNLIDDVYYKDIIRDANYMIPQFAAWITASARIRLDELTEAIGRDRVRYRDTDSCGAKGLLTPAEIDKLKELHVISPVYGDFKVEKVFNNFRIHAPKLYTGHTLDGQWHMTGKGVTGIKRKIADDDPQRSQKITYRDWFIAETHAGRCPEFEYNSTSSLQTYLKTGKLQTVRKRTVTNFANVYGHEIKGGKVRPRELGEWDYG